MKVVSKLKRPHNIKDARHHAVDMEYKEARLILKNYYKLTDLNKVMNAHLRHLKKVYGVEDGVSMMSLKYFCDNMGVLRSHMKTSLDIYTDQYLPSRWVKSIDGAGVLTASALSIHVRADKCPTISQLWRFAGMAPTQQTWFTRKQAIQLIWDAQRLFGENVSSDDHINWLVAKTGRKKENFMRDLVRHKRTTSTWRALMIVLTLRPWCGELRWAMQQVGRCFMRQGKFYRDLYDERHAIETKLNNEGHYKEAATNTLNRYNHNPRTIAYKYYSRGMLPPAHLCARALRWTEKIFLAHYFQVMKYSEEGELPPKPYIIDIKGAKGYIDCPNWPFE